VVVVARAEVEVLAPTLAVEVVPGTAADEPT
jgi:hypothetical protein